MAFTLLAVDHAETTGAQLPSDRPQPSARTVKTPKPINNANMNAVIATTSSRNSRIISALISALPLKERPEVRMEYWLPAAVGAAEPVTLATPVKKSAPHCAFLCGKTLYGRDGQRPFSTAAPTRRSRPRGIEPERSAAGMMVDGSAQVTSAIP
jgi:hypothetical protein